MLAILSVFLVILSLSVAQFMPGGWAPVSATDSQVIAAAKFAVDWYVQGGDVQFLVLDATRQVSSDDIFSVFLSIDLMFFTLKLCIQTVNGLKYDLTVQVNRPSVSSCTINHFVVAISPISASENMVIQDDLLADSCSIVMNGLNNRNNNNGQEEDGVAFQRRLRR